MNNFLPPFLALAFGLVAVAGLSAADHQHGSHDKAEADSAPAPSATGNTEWLNAAKAAYPLDTCVVSDDKLDGSGDMGPPIEYVHKVEGQPGRLIRFCCKSCIGDFKKDPAKFLALIDAAAAKKAAEQKGHSAHP